MVYESRAAKSLIRGLSISEIDGIASFMSGDGDVLRISNEDSSERSTLIAMPTGLG